MTADEPKAAHQGARPRRLLGRFSSWMVERPRWFKRCLLVVNDVVMLSLALWGAYSLRLSELYIPDTPTLWLLFISAPVIGVITFYARGLYKLVTRFIGQEGTTRIYLAVILAVLFWALLVLMLSPTPHPRSVIIIYGLIAAGLIRLSRQWAGSSLLRSLPNHRGVSFDQRPRVVIYGAGPTGVQLLRALNEAEMHKTVAFVDPDPSLHGQYIHGVRVISQEKLPKIITREGVHEVMLALPHARRSQRREALAALEPFPVEVKTVPDLEAIASGRVEISDLRPIDVEDLLGRDPVAPDTELIAGHVRDKVVMITGAGGSIGSELTRQLLTYEPKTLILFELSEVALYEISMEIEAIQQKRGGAISQTRVVTVLGSILDRRLVNRTIAEYDVEVIYHAAAYKHVPIVEMNAFAGIQNNTFGTLALAEEALELGVERFVLISSDKAVRPTNVMGASKRLSELILQAISEERPGSTIFTMVRFGNVLDSSGSVVRRFRNQIEQGGPITVTHPEIIRYFMSIPEAAQLVIQAGAMAAGGEVFVLDMGTPVKIADLARTMVRLSGLQVRDEANPEGDIAIEYCGLRPGEKLYEELLLGENTTGTSHTRIFKTHEPVLPLEELETTLEKLDDAMQRHDEPDLQELLRTTVEGYDQSGASHTLSTLPDWPAASRTVH
ncbi:polysaccharide biosynthesis protein [Methyloligella halotolerans]|nr:nucleoside-diphosphate sugar epimerase/dehydratase [Methyloligella halotolerans]